MGITVRDYGPEDYDVACRWFRDWSWPIPPNQLLSPIGVVAEKDGLPLAMIWLYHTCSAWGVVEWLIRDPHGDKALCREALHLVVEEAKKKAWSVGIEAIFTSVQHPNLIKLYEEHGFLATDTNMTNMVARRPAL